MNKSYRIVWNHARKCLMVVSEATKSHGKGGASKKAVVTAVTAAVAALGATQLAHATTWSSADYNYIVDGTVSHPNVNTGLTTTTISSLGSLDVIAPGSISGGKGLLITKSTLAGYISNSGMIALSVASGPIGGGINIQSSAIGGSITNTSGGTISGVASGIYLGASSIAGAIINRGSIGGGNYGIYISSSSIGGGITNSGLIRGASQAGILVYGSSTVGGINNTVGGTISGGQYGINVTAGGIISSGINNSGSIGSGHTGINVAYASVAGGITNSGAIDGVINYGVLVAASSINGGITNAVGGTISGGYYGIGLYNGSKLSGGITNNGLIRGASSSAAGINVQNSSITGGIINSGLIQGGGGGYGIVVSALSSIDSIYNTGTITGYYGIANSGAITTLANAQGSVAGVAGSSALTYNGNLPTNYVALIGNSASDRYGQLSIAGTYSGTMNFSVGTLSGTTLTNGTTYTGVLQGISYSGINGLTSASSTLTGYVSTQAWVLQDESLAPTFWDLVLSGSSTASGDYGLKLDASSSVTGGINNPGGYTISGAKTGILLTGATVGGGILNAGTISGATLSGINVFNSNLSGGINNQTTGTISGGQTGIAVNNGSTVTGGITNSGLIAGSAYSINLGTASGVPDILITGNNTASFSGAVYAPNTPVTVAGGATYTLNTNFSTPNFDNLGTLIVPVAATASPTITGNLTLGNTGTFSPTVASQTSYTHLAVTGNVALGGALAVNAANVSGTIARGVTLTGIITGSALTGSFASYSTNSILYTFTPLYTGTELDLVVDQRAGASIANSTAATGNKAGAGAANALDAIAGMSGVMAPVTTAFGQMTSNQQISNAVSQTLPVLSGATTFNTMSVLSGINRIIEARHLQNRGLNSGESFMGNNAVWMKPFGTWTDQANQNGAYGFKANTGGLMLGGDSAVSADTRIGGAVAWGNSYATSNAGVAPQSQTSNMYQFIGYGSYAIDQNLEANFQANGGWNNNSSNRQISFMGTSAQGSYSSAVWHVGGGLSSPFAVSESTKLIPSARFDYTWIKNQGYSETGASNGLGLNVNSETYQMSVLGADGKIVHQLSDHNSVNANIGVGYNFSPTQTWVAAAFQGAPSLQFTTNGVNPAAVMGRAGAGYTYKIRQDVDVGVRYDIDFQNTYTNQTASVKGRWMF